MLSRSWKFSRLEGLFFHDIHKTQGRSLSKSPATEYEKYVAGKCTRYAHLWREVHKSNIRVTRERNKYKMLNCIEAQFLFKRFSYQVQSDYIIVL